MEQLDFFDVSVNKGVSIKNFYPTDTEELFKINSATQPPDWPYHNDPIEYSLNSLGYREREFDTIDWANSIVIIGCSNVLGVGLHERNTVGSQITQMTGRPTVNLGVGGASIEFAMLTGSILKLNRPRPLAVVNVWTQYDRCTEFNGLGHAQNYVAGNVDAEAYFMTINRKESNQLTRAKYYKAVSHALWKDTGVKYFDCSYFKETAILLQCTYIEKIDSARDIRPIAGSREMMAHPGSKTNANAAWTIAIALGLI